MNLPYAISPKLSSSRFWFTALILLTVLIALISRSILQPAVAELHSSISSPSQVGSAQPVPVVVSVPVPPQNIVLTPQGSATPVPNTLRPVAQPVATPPASK